MNSTRVRVYLDHKCPGTLSSRRKISRVFPRLEIARCAARLGRQGDSGMARNLNRLTRCKSGEVTLGIALKEVKVALKRLKGKNCGNVSITNNFDLTSPMNLVPEEGTQEGAAEMATRVCEIWPDANCDHPLMCLGNRKDFIHLLRLFVTVFL